MDPVEDLFRSLNHSMSERLEKYLDRNTLV
jgi:hypothetical protein